MLKSKLTTHGRSNLINCDRSEMWKIFAANSSIPVDSTKIDLWHAGASIPGKVVVQILGKFRGPKMHPCQRPIILTKIFTKIYIKRKMSAFLIPLPESTATVRMDMGSWKKRTTRSSLTSCSNTRDIRTKFMLNQQHLKWLSYGPIKTPKHNPLIIYLSAAHKKVGSADVILTNLYTRRNQSQTKGVTHSFNVAR